MGGLQIRKEPISIFSASAGAGKTFRLVAEYLSVALCNVNEPHKFREILALTFTNKAANEMKQKILEALKEFSNKDRSGKSKGIGETVCSILNISTSELEYRSRLVIEEMLHDYGSIAIGTIDQFTHRLVRTFSLELGLPGRFDVEIESDLILETAIYNLIQDVGLNHSLSELLVDFAKSNVENEKNTDIFPALLKISYQLTKETAIDPMKSMEEWSLDKHLSFQKILTSLERSYIKIAREHSNEIIKLLKQIPNEKMYHNDWWESIIKRLKLKDPLGWAPSKSLSAIGKNPDRLLKKEYLSEKKEYSILIGQIIEQLNQVSLLAAKAVLLDEVRKNDRSSSVLTEISKKLELIFDQLNIQPIWKFNGLINDEINKAPASYIFERIGDRYKHFFIDEAQDTSELQWENLWPLLENSTSDQTLGGTVMIVGDAKQSIYRWRGSRAEKFLSLMEHCGRNDSPSLNLPSLKGRTEHIRLNENWRSAKSIVEFNNDLFSSILEAKDFSNDLYKNTYKDSTQIPRRLKEGRIHLRLLENDHSIIELNALDMLVKDIRSAQDREWCLSDMAILVRTKKQGMEVANHLAKESINIISPELLSLASSRYVLTMVSLMEWMIYPDEKSRQWELILRLFEAGIWKANEDELHYQGQIISDNHPDNFKQLIKEILPNFHMKIASQLNLYELAEYMLRAIGVAKKADPFIISFLDKTHEFSFKKGNYLQEFLIEFKKKKKDWSISSPDIVDAINVMTIHKSKGLEFPIVFVPFVSFPSKNDEKNWFELNYNSVFELNSEHPPRTLLSLKSFKGRAQPLKASISQIYPDYVNRSSESQDEQIFDDINLLYVAFTRPQESLTIYLDKSVYGKMIFNELSRKYEFINGELIIGNYRSTEIGTNEKGEDSFLVKLNKCFSSDWTKTVKIFSKPQSGREQRMGNSIHRVLERVRVPEDMSKAMDMANQEFQWSKEEYNFISKKINSVLDDSRLSMLFNAEEIYSERPLIVPGQGIYRPDRLVKCKNGSWVVVDYKTGEQKKEHQEKINNYAIEIGSVIGAQPQTILLYIGDKIVIYEN